jgi:hypothetical protein
MLQVVSRAHRMGQRGTVKVEVLAMSGTAEETLLVGRLALAGFARHGIHIFEPVQCDQSV